MPSFDEVESGKGIAIGDHAFPAIVLKSAVKQLNSINLGVTTLSAMMDIEDDLRPFVVLDCYLRLQVTTLVGVGGDIDIAVGYTSTSTDTDALIEDVNFLVNGFGAPQDLILGMRTSGTGGKGVVLNSAGESLFGILQDSSDVPVPSGHTPGAIDGAGPQFIGLLTRPTGVTELTGQAQIWVTGFSLKG